MLTLKDYPGASALLTNTARTFVLRTPCSRNQFHSHVPTKLYKITIKIEGVHTQCEGMIEGGDCRKYRYNSP